MSSERHAPDLATLAVHGGEDRRKYAGSITVPIAQTSTYVFEDLDAYARLKDGETQGYEYGRYGNPTQRAAEAKIAALEGASDGLLFASGMSAITSTVLAMMRAGQHLIVLGDCYRMTVRFCRLLEKFGVDASVVPAWDMEALAAAAGPTTRLLITEAPTNPHLRVPDLGRLVDFCRCRGIRLVVDSTFATPVNLRPLAHGVDLVVHSATKYLGGHNDLVAGGIFGSDELVGAIREYQRVTGAIVDPMTSYLLLRGLKTLAVRVERQNANAALLAEYLAAHPKVRRVYYPGLQDHPDHAAARNCMDGYGGVVSFEVDGDLERTRRFIDNLAIPYLAPSLGGVESLATHPATMSFYDLSHAERLAIGITDQLVRYAVGIEQGEDLRADLEAALAAA